MKRPVVGRAFLALWTLIFAGGIPAIAGSQDTPAAVSSRQELGLRGSKFIASRFAIDPTNVVPKTNQPLSGKGSWFVSKDTPAICGKTMLPCVLLSYTEPGTDVICEWTLLFGSQDGLLLDLNEEAARYFMNKLRDKDHPNDSAGAEWSGGKRVSSVRPIYPETANAAHIQGDVKLLVRFSESGGRPADIQVISGPTVLRDPAADAVGQWVYTPLLINSVPISTRNLITVRYHTR
ncbi:energy transducer TonB [Edaphobacter aggregans]|uniref:energy transducer TonB n=1 Tax=Edaphobacter aggregans TaxID=570835 RepID=UPI00068E58C1|nr:energy transducer TonB [Edaphobacter aggregans]